MLWLTTVTGHAFQYADGRIDPVHLPPPADTLRLRGTFEDHSGTFWFGTDNQGAVRFANGKATRFTIAEGLRNNGIQAFFEDRDPASVDRHHQRTQPLGRLAFPELLSGGGPVLRVGSRDRGRPQRRHAGGHGPRAQPLPRRHGSWQTPAFAASGRDRIWSIYAEPRRRDTLWIGTRGGGLVRVRDAQGLPNHNPGRAIEQLDFPGDRRWRAVVSG